MDKIWSIFVFTVAFSQYCRASGLADSPDGKWSIQTTREKTLPAVALLNSGGRPQVVIDRDTTGSKRLTAGWSPDSQKVVLLDQAPLGSGITAAWYDGTRWHASVESDSDLEQAQQLARSQGINGQLKAEQRTLGNWISGDTVQIQGTLRYLGGQEFSYSYNLQIVPGSYPMNRGGFETGGLKATAFRTR